MNMSDHNLADRYEAAIARCDAVMTEIYGMAEHEGEGFSDVCARLGTKHPTVSAFHTLARGKRAIEEECRRRLGDGVIHMHFASTLRSLASARKHG